jgi:membrane associated rhomboid family serine protease
MDVSDAGLDPELAAAPQVRERFRRALTTAMAVVVAMGAVFFAQPWLPVEALAITPQQPHGLVGVLFAPLLHGSFGHLAANSFAVLVLGTLAGTVFPRATVRALPVIWLLSGLGTWLIGTGGVHLGASGVTHGLGFLVFTLGVLRRDRPAIAAALIGFLLFGGMLASVLPVEMGISWEYHLSGALAGIACGIVWRRADPEPPRRRYSWEDEAEVLPDDTLEPPAPADVPVLWQRPPAIEERGVVLPFRRPDAD